MATYKERYLAGEIEFEEIDDQSYRWGMSDDERTLAQYLGLNAEEEDAWVSIGEEALKELLDKQKQNIVHRKCVSSRRTLFYICLLTPVFVG